MIRSGTLQHWATFLAWGYSPGDIRQLATGDLAGFELSAPLTRFVTGVNHHRLYGLFNGRRYPLAVPPAGLANFPLRVSQVPDDVLASAPLGEGQFPAPVTWPNKPPDVSAAAWFEDGLWIADDTGAISVDPGDRPVHGRTQRARRICHRLCTARRCPVRRDKRGRGDLASGAGQPAAAWQAPAGSARLPSMPRLRFVAADRSHLDLIGGGYRAGRGILGDNGQPAFLPDDAAQHITALAFQDQTLWAGTDYAGLLRCDVEGQSCTALNTFNSNIPDNAIRDVKIRAGWRAVDRLSWRRGAPGGRQLSQHCACR